jgi:hypothetical protein
VQAERVSITRFNNNEPRVQVNRTDREDRFGLDTEGQGGANLRPRWVSLQERVGQAGIGVRNTTDHQDATRDPPMLGRHYREDERGLERGPSEGAVVFSSGASGAASESSGALHSADVNPRPVQCRALRGYCRSSSGPTERSLHHGRSSLKFRPPDPCPLTCTLHAICLLAMRNERACRRRMNWPIY